MKAKVIWEVDLDDAYDALDAATKALRIQRLRGANSAPDKPLAHVFDVIHRETGESKRVILDANTGSAAIIADLPKVSLLDFRTRERLVIAAAEALETLQAISAAIDMNLRERNRIIELEEALQEITS